MSVLSRNNPVKTPSDFPLLGKFNEPFDLWNFGPSGFFRLYDDLLKMKPRVGEAYPFTPEVDIVETDAEVRVTAELPGLDEKQISISVTPESLTLSGEKKIELKEEKEGYQRFERARGAFLRELPMPCEIDVNKVDAKLHAGVLTVTLKKSAQARTQSRKVEIKPD